MSVAIRRGKTASGPAALVVGCLVLAARPILVAWAPSPTLLLVAVFSVLLVVGVRARVPVGTESTASRGRFVAVVAVGVLAFGAGRVLGGGLAPHTPTARFLALNLFAAIAEEAFFRRAVFGALLTSGPAVAVVGSAALFAIVHVSVYGLWVLPIDLAAGLLLSWQRWASGSWTAPALTHALANMLVLL